MFFINWNKKAKNIKKLKNLKTLKVNHIFKRNYTNLDKITKKAVLVKDGFIKMQDALKKFEYSSNLIYFDRACTVFLIAGFFSWSLSILGISIIFSSFTLAIISILEFSISFCLNLYVYIKRLHFIYNYDLDCNSNLWVKILSVNTATTRFGVKTAMFICGATVSSNYVICEITDVSVFKEIGKDYVYGDNSFSETTRNIYYKIKNGQGPRD